LDNNQTVTYDSIQVWTSEGVTDQNPVTFIWPQQAKDFLIANALCPDTRPKAAVAPSADAGSKQLQTMNITRDSSSTADQPSAGASAVPTNLAATAAPGIQAPTSVSVADKTKPPVLDPSMAQSVKAQENPASIALPNKSP
jgi:hypothetical protein